MRRRYWWDAEAKDWVEERPVVAPKVHLISDHCDLKSMADGKRYTSKSRYKAELRARGYEIVGNERPALGPREIPDARLSQVLGDVMREKYRG